MERVRLFNVNYPIVYSTIHPFCYYLCLTKNSENMHNFMRQKWWKFVSVALVIYAIIGGFLFEAPRLDILNETIRCVHYHVPMWFGMVFLYLISLVFSIKQLASNNLSNDIIAEKTAIIGVVYCALGLTTGMIWAQYTWGDWWNGDPKQNMSAIAMLIYLAYLVLRSSIKDIDTKARIAAVYNIFAFFAMIVLIFVIPRLTDSLHPGSGNNSGFAVYDLDNDLRLVFYPSTIGFMGIGLWMASFLSRVQRKTYEKLELIKPLNK